MKLYGLTKEQVIQAIDKVSAERYGGNLKINHDAAIRGSAKRPCVQFRLQVKNSRLKGARRSGSGRRTVSACWHCHRDVMKELFAVNPDCKIVTALATYEHALDFQDKYQGTRHKNIGSVNEPQTLQTSCDCKENEGL